MRSFPFRPFTLVAALAMCVGSAWADSISITGTAAYGDDLEQFFISGPSLSLNSAAPGAFAGILFTCAIGQPCQVPSFTIGAFQSDFGEPGNFSGGSVNGVIADTLFGSLTFSSSLLQPTSDPGHPFGPGDIRFTGEVTGYLFSPPGCESSGTCSDLGPKVFDLRLRGTGTITTLSENIGEGMQGIFLVNYQYSGTATVVPEPSSIYLIVSGFVGLAGVLRRKSRTVG